MNFVLHFVADPIRSPTHAQPPTLYPFSCACDPRTGPPRTTPGSGRARTVDMAGCGHALPAHWVDKAGEIVLRRLVAQAAVAERREARLRGLRATGRDIGEDADALVTHHGVGAKVVAFLLGTLRATPKARERSRAAEPAVNCAAKFTPWEIWAGDAS